MENDFQAGEIDVLVGTIGAMKEGITLTAASNMIFLERHWTPAVNEQCEDRCHRNGQKNAVTILIFEAEDTVDAQKISPTNAIKSLIVSSVIAKDDVAERRRK
jgi:SWI/SNF-related matrix-associated actin-dependent regulator 1 of chromatin subfamily A